MQRRRARRLVDVDVEIEVFEDALEQRERGLDVDADREQLPDREEEPRLQGRERDQGADRDGVGAVGEAEAGEPVDLVATERTHHEHGQHGRHGGAGRDGGRVQDAPPGAQRAVQRGQRRGHQQRYDAGQGGQLVHGRR